MTTLETLQIFDDMIENLRSQKLDKIEYYLTEFYDKIRTVKMQFNDFVLKTSDESHDVFLESNTNCNIFHFNVAQSFMSYRDDENADYNTIVITHELDCDVMNEDTLVFNLTFDLNTDVLQFQKIVFNYMTDLMIEQMI